MTGLVYYFAYGSNLSKDRLKGRIGEWRESRKGLLEGYRLTFDSRGRTNIIEKVGERVWGVLYLVTREQLDKLDTHEGAPHIYKRKEVKVRSNDQIIDAITYQRTEKTSFSKPSSNYLQLILTGLREHSFDEIVVKEVERIANGQT